jgi:alkylated DNA repair protein (DNA oxidative demethylase)
MKLRKRRRKRAMTAPIHISGFQLWKTRLNSGQQGAMVAALREVADAAPFFSPETRWGRKMSVRMTSAGRVGWVSDRRGYRYEARHPVTGAPWPPIPAPVLAVWREVAGWPDDPDCCLINFYGAGARMGMHRDADEGEAGFAAPVVSISLGDPAVFRIGGLERGGKTSAVTLESGDVVVMGGTARLAYHGVDKVLFGGSTLLPGGGRINVTLRVVRSV